MAKPSPSPGPSCAEPFRIAFVTDVAGLRSATDAAGWQGVRQAMTAKPCLQAELISAAYPTDYRHILQLAVDHRSDLVIAGSFLLSDAVVETAIANPGTHFVLVNPLVATSGPNNLAIITFRDEEAGFLAGRVAGLATTTGVVAGVYALEDQHNRDLRLGFERGARSANPSVRVLGIYQGARDGSPYANPEWGATQARDFIAQRADVIFGSGDLTGAGAMGAAASAGKPCITIGVVVDPSHPSCLLGTVLLRADRTVAMLISDGADGVWQSGDHSYGVAEGAIELNVAEGAPLPAQRPAQTLVVTPLGAAHKI